MVNSDNFFDLAPSAIIYLGKRRVMMIWAKKGMPRIQAERIKLVYKQLKIVLYAQWLIMTLYTCLLWEQINQSLLLSWYLITFLVCILGKVALLYFYHKSAISVKNLKRWKRLFVFSAASAGLSWGCAGSILMPLDFIHQFYVFFILAGVAASGIAFYAPIWSAYITYLSATLGFPIVWLLLQGKLYTPMVVLGLVYFSVMLITSFYSYKSTHHIFLLRRKNLSLEKKLEILATHDPLTGLANRRLFKIKFIHALLRARRYKTLVAILYMDLDNFKRINDTLGHTIGDKLLIQVAHRIKTSLRNIDTIARMGGDEFAILLEDIKNTDIITEIATHIRKIIAHNYKIDEHTISISTSIGISYYPKDGVNKVILIKRADHAMYYAKNLGKNQFQFYSKNISDVHLFNE